MQDLFDPNDKDEIARGGGAAQHKSGVACWNKFPCGMGSVKFKNCMDCVHKAGVKLVSFQLTWLYL